MELTKHHRDHYGPSWNIFSASPERCAAAVWNGVGFYQCQNKRHPDTLDGAFCKTHCPERKKARQVKRDAARRVEAAGRRAYHAKEAKRRALEREAARLLEPIAEGRPITDAVFAWLEAWKAAK